MIFQCEQIGMATPAGFEPATFSLEGFQEPQRLQRQLIRLMSKKRPKIAFC